MSILKHHNFKYDGNIPFFTGDRRYGQDIIRDFWSLISYIGEGLKGIAKGNSSFIFTGGDLSVGSDFTKLNIDAFWGYINTEVEIPNSFSTTPPSKSTVDIPIPVFSSTITDFDLSSATLDGVTPNYVKVSYLETDGNTRDRAKKAGNYAYEVTPLIQTIVNSTPATSNEVTLGTLLGDGSTYLNITEASFVYDGIFSYLESKGRLVSQSINTGQGDVECYGMDQAVKTGDNVSFNSVKTEGTFLKTKVIEIGDWDMSASVSVNIAHGLSTNYKKIKSIDVIIRDDTDVTYRPLSSIGGTGDVLQGGVSSVSATNVNLRRLTLGIFDNTSYDSTSYNRGWITIVYEI